MVAAPLPASGRARHGSSGRRETQEDTRAVMTDWLLIIYFLGFLGGLLAIDILDQNL